MLTYTRTGTLGHERLTVRQHRDTSAMHAFLNKGDNACKWREYSGNLKAGTYAFVGGEWRNVRTLDPYLLPHV